jgi:hypothetical protein
MKLNSLIKPCAIWVLSLSFSLLANAQNSDPGAAARSNMQQLKVLEGDYILTVQMSQDGGKTWQDGEPHKVSIRLRHKDLLLEELPIKPGKQGFHMNTYLTFDQYRSVFRKAAIDDVWGVMDIYHGNILNDTLVLTNLQSGTLFPVAEGVWRGFRLSVPLTAGKRIMLIEKSDDHGQTWQPAFRSVYTPVGPYTE